MKRDLEHLEAFTPDSTTGYHASDLIYNTTAFFSEGGAKRSESADHFGRTPRLGRVAMVNLGRSNPAGWGLARGLLYLFDRRNKGRTRAWGRSVSTGFDRVQQDYCSRKGYFSPTRPFRFTDTSPTVRPVPWAIQPTSCPARSVWEPSYHIDCHFHGCHLCRQVAPDYPLYWVPRSRQGPPYCECVRGNKQVHGAASYAVQTPPRNCPLYSTSQSFVAESYSRPVPVHRIGSFTRDLP